MGIPSDTVVPTWAYQDAASQGSFDVTLVNSTTQPGIFSTTQESTPTNSSSGGPSETAMTTTPSTKSKNVGVIAGSIVGGIAGVFAIASSRNSGNHGGTFCYV